VSPNPNNSESQLSLSSQSTELETWGDTLPKSVSQLSDLELSQVVSGLTLVLGRRGRGKTFAQAAIASLPLKLLRYQAALQQKVIYDPTGSLSAYWTGSETLHIAETSEEVHTAFSEQRFPLSVQCSAFDQATFNYLCECVWATGNTLFVIDEGDTCLLQSNTRYLSEVQQNLLSRGRHRNISLLVSVRRPVEVPLTVRSFVECMLIFQTTLKQDLDAIEAVFGYEINPRKLAIGEFLLLRP
jgi:hypothetical protein